ncbi:uncharacterized protein LOC119647721 [Hermetia illucens]|nr:uncharacterized protein LOC119647721 [Hermetia illucens]
MDRKGGHFEIVIYKKPTNEPHIPQITVYISRWLQVMDGHNAEKKKQKEIKYILDAAKKMDTQHNTHCGLEDAPNLINYVNGFKSVSTFATIFDCINTGWIFQKSISQGLFIQKTTPNSIMKFLVLALALIGAASAGYVAPVAHGYGWGNGLGYAGGLGWGHGVGYAGGLGWGHAAYSAPVVSHAVAAPVVSHAVAAPAVAAYAAPAIAAHAVAAPVVSHAVAAPAIAAHAYAAPAIAGHAVAAPVVSHGYGWGSHAYAAPAWGYGGLWKKKAAH